MRTEEVDLTVPEGHQLILGQSHFIKSVDDLFEALATSMPGIRFGVAFCEASGKALIRFDGTDDGATTLAKEFARKVASGHCFAIVLRDAFPINVLNRIKAVEEVTGVYCATANSVVVIVGDTGSGRAVLGVADGVKPKGEESEADRSERREFLKKIGYKR